MEREGATAWASCLRRSGGVNQEAQRDRNEQSDARVRPLSFSQHGQLSRFLSLLLLADGRIRGRGSGGHGGQLVFRKRAVESGKFLFDELLVIRDGGGELGFERV